MYFIAQRYKIVFRRPFLFINSLVRRTKMNESVLKTFLYFGFGSNLLEKRIHMNNPSATRKGIGRIEDYRLDFGFWSKHWNGAVATIVPDAGKHVWGAVWEISTEDIPNLDRQEGVANGIYKVVYVDVETPDKKTMKCRCYMLCNLPTKIPENEPVPEERKPSQAYMNVILRGAVESNLPKEYIAELQKIEHNGWNELHIEKIMLTEEGHGK